MRTKAMMLLAMMLLMFIVPTAKAYDNSILDYISKGAELRQQEEMQKRNLAVLVGLVLFGAIGFTAGWFSPKREDPLQHLKERLTLGEITPEEYERIQSLLQPKNDTVKG